MVPLYLLEKIARHGMAAQRLIDERKRREGEHFGSDDGGAVAFEAADFVVTFLALCGDESVLETRELRNNIAQLVGTAIREHKTQQQPEEEAAVFENDGRPLAPGQYDGMQYVLEEEDGESASKSQIEAYVRDTGHERFLSVHMTESLRQAFGDCLQKGEFNASWFGSSLALELSVQPEWLTDSRQRAAAKRRVENQHIRVPLDAIKITYAVD
ncbi:hypothetical protein [Paraburkholderia sp.]|uniref:hypothetical protein n=1 Tax=Paraburkholderia sp. TaxID=1926495 RepID=UPI0025E6EBF0|nr:hypothetical protein [Paraburkholderia sp.]